MHMKQLLDRYRGIASELVSIGASSSEAQALAAALSVRDSDSGAEDGFSQLQNIKSRGETYIYRGTTIDVGDLVVNRTAKGGEQLTITLSCRRGNEFAKARFKGDQAFRIIAILALKFVEFEKDAQEGFNIDEIIAQEGIIVARLTSRGHKITAPGSATVELNRSIRKKAMEGLGLGDFLYTRGRDYRIELGPGAFAFDAESLELFDALTDGCGSEFFKRYHLPMRKHR